MQGQGWEVWGKGGGGNELRGGDKIGKKHLFPQIPCIIVFLATKHTHKITKQM